MRRSYGQYCGLARALDVVGDRWNLLIVRQLLVGPARYGQLLDGLPGLATNLLVNRLRDLETAGVIERRLADEGNAISYALTPWGAELREPIDALIRWSTPLMTRGPGGDAFRAEWLIVALQAGAARGKPRSEVHQDRSRRRRRADRCAGHSHRRRGGRARWSQRRNHHPGRCTGHLRPRRWRAHTRSGRGARRDQRR